VDAETGEEVDSADIIKGYEVAKGEYIELETRTTSCPTGKWANRRLRSFAKQSEKKELPD
jgi:non-homologous end joining protein Ku